MHIADVSHYVTPGSPVDAEAYRRGTSVYFADRVIPMLPETLSNGACSLYAGEDRLTMSALMDFDESGECLRSEIFPSVIRSCVRGVYSEVNDLFMNSAEESVNEKYAGALCIMLNLSGLAAGAAAAESVSLRRGYGKRLRRAVHCGLKASRRGSCSMSRAGRRRFIRGFPARRRG